MRLLYIYIFVVLIDLYSVLRLVLEKKLDYFKFNACFVLLIAARNFRSGANYCHLQLFIAHGYLVHPGGRVYVPQGHRSDLL